MTTALLGVLSLVGYSALAQVKPEVAPPGQLTQITKEGRPAALVPLERTSVKADIAGMTARVTVVQTFTNPSKTPIEAVYTFPLAADSAVDRMRMQVGERIIEGEIKRREEARAIYDAAKNAGQAASLLDQERPNIFTQSVANIMPGAKIRIEISYVQAIKFENGTFEFSFPMVVGPRFMPASTPDPDKIDPPITPKGTRTGTNIDLTVSLDGGAPIKSVKSVLHATKVQAVGANRANIVLSRADEIPNRDFILQYQVQNDHIEESFHANARSSTEGTFCLTFLPPKKVKDTEIRPREIIFVMDQSGSQQGFPIEKSKELTLRMLKEVRAGDTFNVFGFSTNVNRLWPAPQPMTEASLREAEAFVKGLQANGGTQLLPVVDAALTSTPPEGRMRLVVFNTDGFVGNEFEILNAIREKAGQSRMFTFGIGNSVNRFLIDAMSLEGRGDSEIVTLADQADPAVARFLDRTQSPVLTDLVVTVDGVPVEDMTPNPVPDVFADRPIMVFGRYLKPGKATIKVSGRLGNTAWSREFDVTFPAQSSASSGLTTMWARRRVDDIMRTNWLAASAGTNPEADAVRAEVTRIGLEYGIMTQFTSFVAVEKRVINVGGKQRTVAVPIEMADGVSYEGVGHRDSRNLSLGAPGGPPATKAVGRSSGGFGGAGGGGGSKLGEAGDMGHERQRAQSPESKIDPKLLKSSKAEHEVQVLLTKWSDDVLAALKKAGLTVDAKEPGLKVVFGRISAAKLKELAKIVEVDRIKPLDP